MLLQQARLAAQYAIRDGEKKLYAFDEYVLPLMPNYISRSYDRNVLCTNRLQRLITYDRQNESNLIQLTLSHVRDNVSDPLSHHVTKCPALCHKCFIALT